MSAYQVLCSLSLVNMGCEVESCEEGDFPRPESPDARISWSPNVYICTSKKGIQMLKLIRLKLLIVPVAVCLLLFVVFGGTAFASSAPHPHISGPGNVQVASTG